MLRVVYIILLLINLYKGSILNIQVGDDKLFKFNEFMKPCPAVKQTIKFDEMKFYTNTTYFGFDYKLVMPMQLNAFRLELYFWRCPSAENPDACIQFSSFKTNNGCKLVDAKSTIWTPIIDCLTPKFKCPAPKNDYIGKQCGVDVGAFKFFPLIGAYWKLKVRIFVDKQEVYCSTTEGAMVKL